MRTMKDQFEEKLKDSEGTKQKHSAERGEGGKK